MKLNRKIILTIVISGLLSACHPINDSPPLDSGNDDNNPIEAIFTGVIEEIYEETSAVVTVESGDILNSADKVTIDLTKGSDDMVFEVGDKVEVTYDGEVRESYPAQINTLLVEKIE